MTQQLTVGQKIVHRRYGAGTVVRVRKGRKDEEFDNYYVIDIPSRDLKVHLPVNSDQKMDLRALATKAKMNRAMRILSENPEDLPRDYRERRAFISEALKEGTVIALAQVIRDLVGLKSRKTMSTLEATWLGHQFPHLSESRRRSPRAQSQCCAVHAANGESPPAK